MTSKLKKIERQCTKSGSHAVGLQENSSKKITQCNTIYTYYTRHQALVLKTSITQL